jgi:xylan 1,4-beta-xylosidase
MPQVVTRRALMRGLALAPLVGAARPAAAQGEGEGRLPGSAAAGASGAASPTAPAAFHCDLSAPARPLRHPWRRCVGSCHAPLALRADWQRQLARAHRELGFEQVRFHGLLSDDMGTLVEQDGRLLPSFFNVDSVFDFLRETGMRPVVELSFMPTAIASGGATVFRYRGNITPPRRMADWTNLVTRLAAHWCERYGVDEVAQWPIEVWNEPNLKYFWTAGQARWFELFRATHAALKAVSPRLQVGGPVTAANGWLEEFDAFCARAGCPPDFLSTHYYPTDAFGETWTDTVSQLAAAPMSVMRDRALEARRVAGARPLYYTEWNITSNGRDPLHDGPFCAALALRLALSVDELVDTFSWWTFTDIFEEDYLPSRPFHGGFGLLTLHGVPKPAWRGFELLARLGTRTWEVQGVHPTVAAVVGAGADPGATAVLLTNVAMPRHPIAAEPVTMTLARPDARTPRRATVTRIDAGHANPRAAWEAMGSPEYLAPHQVEALHAASALVEEPLALEQVATAAGPRTRFALELPPDATALVRIEWEGAA